MKTDSFKEYLTEELRRLQGLCQSHIANEVEHGDQETVNLRFHEYQTLLQAEFNIIFGDKNDSKSID